MPCRVSNWGYHPVKGGKGGILKITSYFIGIVLAATLTSCESLYQLKTNSIVPSNFTSGPGPTVESAINDPKKIAEYLCASEDEEDDEPKALVCHYPSGNPAQRHDICIGKSALPAHIDKHGQPGAYDHLGKCDRAIPSPSPSPSPSGLPEINI